MKRFITATLVCMAMMTPVQSHAYEGQMSGSGATQVSYTASDFDVTAPIETVVIPPKTDDEHETTGYMLTMSIAILLIFVLLYRREEEGSEGTSVHV